MEWKYGKIFILCVFSYIIVNRNGIIVNELEDVLLLDDDVIDDVY